MKRLYILLLAATLLSGCARMHAKTTPDNPPLDMPAPPPRDVEPTEVETLPPVPLAQEPARNAPTRRQQPAREPAKTEPARPAEPPKPAETPATTEPPKPATPAPTEEPPKPATTLQTTPTAVEGDLERTIRATITRATSDLMRVDYRTLNADAKTQYDYAKRYMRQAEEAMRAKNMLFAKTLADKAAVVAAQLAGR
jgi:hypothetical protein